MKLPNGYGSVTKLSGNRRKPYLARVTLGWITNEQTGKTIQNRVPIGTYKTKKEALQALAEYGANPYDIQNNNLTLAELYQKWTEAYFPTLSGESSTRTITSAWKYCHPLYKMRVKDLRARHIKGIMEDGYIISSRGKNALEYEIVDKNYARTFDISEDIIKEKEAATRGHIIFPPDEMKILWDNVDKILFADWVLIQCYMGWRPQELATLQLADVNLDEWYMVAGMKTDAGKNRMVPIHTKIQPLVKRNDYAVSLGSDALFNDPTATKGGMKITYDKYAGRFDKVMAALKLNPEHRPHDPRMTFITMAKKAGIDPMVVKRLAGHRINDVTEAVYTVRDLEWLRSDIEKIP